MVQPQMFAQPIGFHYVQQNYGMQQQYWQQQQQMMAMQPMGM